jgi:hypothetical protein
MSDSRKADFCTTFYLVLALSLRKKWQRYMLCILFFLTRKEPKENRRCANRSPFPSYGLQGGFQGTRTDLLPID